MTKRYFRIVRALCILVGTSATVALTIVAFQQNMLYFYTPTQLLEGEIDPQKNFRVGGLVVDDSVQREKGSLQVDFAITDTVNVVPVAYLGVLPDLFREGQGVVVRGRWRENMIMADEVLAKHDENYMPPEVQDALEAARSMRQ